MQERHGSAADDGGLFGSFPISVLFARPANASRLRLGDINGRGLPLIGSGTGNRGVRGRTDKPAEPCPAGTITLDFLGNAYYRAFPYKMTRNHVMSLQGMVIADEMTGIYLECMLSWFSKVFSYDYELTWDRIKDCRIPLPVSVPAGEDGEWDGNDIDFDRIHAMIAPKMRACGDRIARIHEWILRTAGANDGGADGAAPFRRSPHADDADGVHRPWSHGAAHPRHCRQDRQGSCGGQPRMDADHAIISHPAVTAPLWSSRQEVMRAWYHHP